MTKPTGVRSARRPTRSLGLPAPRRPRATSRDGADEQLLLRETRRASSAHRFASSTGRSVTLIDLTTRIRADRRDARTAATNPVSGRRSPRRYGCVRLVGDVAAPWASPARRPGRRRGPRGRPVRRTAAAAPRHPRTGAMQAGRLGRMTEYEAVIGLRVPRRAQHRDEDVLWVPQHVRRAAQHERLPGVPRPSGFPAGAGLIRRIITIGRAR